LLVAIGEGVYDTVEVVNDDVLYKVEFTTFVRVELRDIAREAEEAEEALFINISDGYGNPEIVTVSDYQELNPDAIFEINGDEIWEVDADGRCVEVVARAEETEEAVEADDDDYMGAYDALAEEEDAEEDEDADEGFDYTGGYIYAEPAEEADFEAEARYIADADARADAEEEARHAVDAETVDSDENGDDALAEEEDAEDDYGYEGTWFELNSVGCEYFASDMDEGFLTTRAILRAAHGGECDITFGEAGFQVFTTDYMGNQVHIGDIVELPAFIDAPVPNVPPTSDRDDFSDWVKITPRPATAIAKLNEEIPYVLTHNDSGYQDEVTPPRWVATWVMDTWMETYTFRAHLDGSAPGYPTEATAIAVMAGDEPAPFENSAGGEDRWTLQTLDLSRCHFENGHWYAN